MKEGISHACFFLHDGEMTFHISQWRNTLIAEGRTTVYFLDDFFFLLKGRLPPFLHKTVFTRPKSNPPMTYPEVCFPEFGLVFKISAIGLQIKAITNVWNMGM